MNLDAYSQSLNQKDQICSSMMMNNEEKNISARGDLSRRVIDSDSDEQRYDDEGRLDEKSLDNDPQKR